MPVHRNNTSIFSVEVGKRVLVVFIITLDFTWKESARNFIKIVRIWWKFTSKTCRGNFDDINLGRLERYDEIFPISRCKIRILHKWNFIQWFHNRFFEKAKVIIACLSYFTVQISVSPHSDINFYRQLYTNHYFANFIAKYLKLK